MMRIFAIAATAGLVIGTPASAVGREDRSVITQYVRARAADSAGMADAAAAQYAQVLAASPDDAVLALRAYRQAIVSGDRALALAGARTLEAKGALPPDARLLLLAEAVSIKDWTGAGRIADAIEREDIFGFLVPAMRAWIALGAKDGDPLTRLDARRAGSLASIYAGENRALLLLATGRRDEGVAAIRAQGLAGGGRAIRLRLAAAAALAAAHDRDEALALLQGDDPTLEIARARITEGKPLPGAILTPADGVAELFVRVAIDINRERVTPLALTMARIATFLAPGNAETWLVTSELLAAAGQNDPALAALAGIRSDDPFGESARDARVQLLIRKGEQKAALAEAMADVARPGATAADWSNVGDIQADMNARTEAAASYAKAIALADKDPAYADQRWRLWMLRGGALEQSGNWPEAKAALETALSLAPDQAVVLNYLGYAQIERRENLDAAEKLIERASTLKPEDAAITDSLGWVYYLRGDVPKAIATLERAVEGEPGEPTINEHLGDAYWAAGRRIDARHAWAAALVYADEKDAARIARKLDIGPEARAIP